MSIRRPYRAIGMLLIGVLVASVMALACDNADLTTARRRSLDQRRLGPLRNRPSRQRSRRRRIGQRLRALHRC